MYDRDPWGGPLEINTADSATDDDRSRNLQDLDRAALSSRPLDETQQSWLLGPTGEQKKKKYVDLGCVIVSCKIFIWTVRTLLLFGLLAGLIVLIVKTVPRHHHAKPPPDNYTLALHKALMFFNAQKYSLSKFLSPPPASDCTWSLYDDPVLQVSLQIEQLPITAALSKFFSDVLLRTSPSTSQTSRLRNGAVFGSGSSAVWVSEFYFQNGLPPPNGLKKQCLSRIDELFISHMDGLQMQEFKTVTKEVCKLPTFLSYSLFREIDTGCSGIVARSSLIDDASSGISIGAQRNSLSANAAGINSLPSMFQAGSTPPLPQRSSSSSPRFSTPKTSPS
ncbi:uncharacterized protein LOC133744254 [Rosa rugosa]|uniref:uncharacterized protein LOC133744254 n=1 Tax=Rosa rugosa TaxID=74645 RepID=UPI002B411767|nr:uncharacterized protein LOC133744254 [Rosa rugosa]